MNIQNSATIGTIIISILFPTTNYVLNTRALAERALTESEHVGDRLERIENKIDKLSEQKFK